MDIPGIGLILIILLVVVIGFINILKKKNRSTPYYTPFDNITGQTERAFQEEVIIVEEQGDDKDKNTKNITNKD